MFEFVRKLPKEDHQLCKDMQDRAEGYIKVQLSGGWYWIPVTRDMKQVFGMTREGNHITCGSYKRDEAFQRVAMDIAWACYLQMRDVVGSEIKEDLSQQITESFAKLFDRRIGRAVVRQINTRLPKPSLKELEYKGERKP